ncbi:hypothetical protein GCM10009092_30880 [Bowmanella denitrificans]|uniref:Sulphotransferase Stf0 domain-containing protein n=1 Tax=Bowmanella denitrificans TaxID=366582 RepID=A0ABP3H9S8_9ALTE|nr:Stf0 family sulfotransferase [Bowmanella denitrificans]
MQLYQDQFSREHDFAPGTKANNFLVIASTQRCGSHMLGHALYSTGLFGFPLEYANPVNLREWEKQLGVSGLDNVLDLLQLRRTSANGVFSIKVHYDHLQVFGGFDKLIKRFPNALFVLLHRRDVLKQAVSFSKARQTGVWITGQKAMRTAPSFDYQDINQCLKKVIQDTASWRYLLAAQGCRYLELEYESLREDLTSGIRRIASAMDILLPISDIREITRRQADELSDNWQQKFVQMHKGKNDRLQPGASGVRTLVRRWLGS